MHQRDERFPRLSAYLAGLVLSESERLNILVAAGDDMKLSRLGRDAILTRIQPGQAAGASQDQGAEGPDVESRSVWSAALETVNTENGFPAATAATAGTDDPWEQAREASNERM